eukprot:9729879-Alexandrium_andersonii.AAC.1
MGHLDDGVAPYPRLHPRGVRARGKKKGTPRGGKPACPSHGRGGGGRRRGEAGSRREKADRLWRGSSL